MDRPTNRLSQNIYYLAATLYYLAVFLRALLTYGESAVFIRSLVLLVAGLALFISEPFISRRVRGYFPFYLTAQTGLVFMLLTLPESPDFFAALLGILSMQVMLNLKPKLGTTWIGACALVMLLLLTESYGIVQSAALTLIYTAGNVFLGTYALVIRREHAVQVRKQELARELQEANRQLHEYSAKLGHLAVARERNRFARELHDSVTQTVFSMNLTMQSALLLFERDPMQVKNQLERLSQLVRSALAEIQSLITSLKPESMPAPGLIHALRDHLASPRVSENLAVILQVDGEYALSVAEQRALLGIAQEALNNIIKHAKAQRAVIRLHLVEPCWMEIQDYGAGFDLQAARRGGRLGLVSMCERAAEVGWEMQIITSPGAGTCVRVVKAQVSEVQE